MKTTLQLTDSELKEFIKTNTEWEIYDSTKIGKYNVLYCQKQIRRKLTKNEVFNIFESIENEFECVMKNHHDSNSFYRLIDNFRTYIKSQLCD